MKSIKNFFQKKKVLSKSENTYTVEANNRLIFVVMRYATGKKIFQKENFFIIYFAYNKSFLFIHK